MQEMFRIIEVAGIVLPTIILMLYGAIKMLEEKNGKYYGLLGTTIVSLSIVGLFSSLPNY